MLLNLDAGERDDESEELWAPFDILNVACGGHAGDRTSMQRIAAFCRGGGRTNGGGRPNVGAHPSYPDRANFGRTTMAIEPAALEASIREQCAALYAIIDDVRCVKPHGALYHDAARDMRIARAVIRGAVAALGTVAVIGPPHGALRAIAAEADCPYLVEGFADRGMLADGSLIPRGEPGALIEDPAFAAAQALALANSVDTICVHGDTPNALAIARAVRAAIPSNLKPSLSH